MAFRFFKKGSLRRKFFVNLVAGIRFMGPLAALIIIIRLVSTWMTRLLDSLPDTLNPYTYLPNAPGIGLIFLILALVFLGWITRKFTDFWLWRLLEKIITSIPVVSGLYKAFKQLTDVILRNPSQDFRQVVLVPFPIKGMYSMGFVTGQTVAVLQPNDAEKYLNIFLPTTPNPTSGFYIQALKTEVVPLDISVEDALRTVISAGVINPEQFPATEAAATEAAATEPAATKQTQTQASGLKEENNIHPSKEDTDDTR